LDFWFSYEILWQALLSDDDDDARFSIKRFKFAAVKLNDLDNAAAADFGTEFKLTLTTKLLLLLIVATKTFEEIKDIPFTYLNV